MDRTVSFKPWYPKILGNQFQGNSLNGISYIVKIFPQTHSKLVQNSCTFSGICTKNSQIVKKQGGLKQQAQKTI